MRLLERDLELGTLGALWAEALAGHGRLVFLGGEAGVGKTSLVSHFAQTSTGRAQVLVGACDPEATPRPLGPLVDVADAPGVRAELDDPDVRRSLRRCRDRSRLRHCIDVLGGGPCANVVIAVAPHEPSLSQL